MDLKTQEMKKKVKEKESHENKSKEEMDKLRKMAD